MKYPLLFVLFAGLAAPVGAQGLPPQLSEVVADDLPRLPVSSVTHWTPTVPGTPARRGPLLVVNGQLLPDSVDIPPAEEIIGLRELEPAEAVRRYGPRARHGALLIDTEKCQRRPRQ